MNKHNLLGAKKFSPLTSAITYFSMSNDLNPDYSSLFRSQEDVPPEYLSSITDLLTLIIDDSYQNNIFRTTYLKLMAEHIATFLSSKVIISTQEYLVEVTLKLVEVLAAIFKTKINFTTSFRSSTS